MCEVVEYISPYKRRYTARWQAFRVTHAFAVDLLDGIQAPAVDVS